MSKNVTYTSDYVNCTESSSGDSCIASQCCQRVSGGTILPTLYCASSSSLCSSGSKYTVTYSSCTKDYENNTCADSCCSSTNLSSSSSCDRGFFCDGYYPEEIAQRISVEGLVHPMEDLYAMAEKKTLDTGAWVALAITLSIAIVLAIILASSFAKFRKMVREENAMVNQHQPAAHVVDVTLQQFNNT